MESETPSTPTNPDLIAALERLEKVPSAESRAPVYTAVLGARFLVPLRNEGHPEPGTPLRIVTFQGDVNELPVFTDWDAAGRWPANVRAPSFAVVAGAGLFQIARKLDITFVLINPYGPIGLRINKAAIAMLADGRIDDV